MQHVGAIVIGAGQAGLAVSYELTARGLEHVVLERGEIGQCWRDRWDSFCLVTPNWSLQLPGFPYDGDDPDGFIERDEIVAYLESYAASFAAPVHTRVEITGIRNGSGSGFVVETDKGSWSAQHLILATGAYQKTKIPAGADTLPASIARLDIGDYRNESELPEGDILIVGSGQSGCQIAEELHRKGRRVVLACGRAPWTHRRFGGRDIFWWLDKSGFLSAPSKDLPEEARLFANITATGHDGGHDLSFRTLDDAGVELTGRFLGAKDGVAQFADDLGASIAWGDERYVQINDVIYNTAKKMRLDVPELPSPGSFNPKTRTEIDLGTFGAALFTGGFRPDYRSWVPWPEAFDEEGFPLHNDGDSTVIDGLHFVGVHFLRTRKSALLCGVGEDAAIVANSVMQL